MKLADHLSDKKREQLNKKRKKKISNKDLCELMGTNRDIFRRGKGGALRSK